MLIFPFCKASTCCWRKTLLGTGASHSPGYLPGLRLAARRLPAGVPAWAHPLPGPCGAGRDPSQGRSRVPGVLPRPHDGSHSTARNCTFPSSDHLPLPAPPPFENLHHLILPRWEAGGGERLLKWEAALPGGALASLGISSGDSGVPGTPHLPSPTRSPAARRLCLLESHFLVPRNAGKSVHLAK